MNIDIEVLCLTLGIQKTAHILETSEEALQAIMANFSPENQSFFLFIKSCLLSYIKKKGNKLAEESLGVSSYALDKILQGDSEPIKKRKVNEVIDKKFIEEIKDNGTFSVAYQKKVLKFYFSYNDIELAASKFCISAELINSWIRDSKRIMQTKTSGK